MWVGYKVDDALCQPLDSSHLSVPLKSNTMYICIMYCVYVQWAVVQCSMYVVRAKSACSHVTWFVRAKQVRVWNIARGEAPQGREGKGRGRHDRVVFSCSKERYICRVHTHVSIVLNARVPSNHQYRLGLQVLPTNYCRAHRFHHHHRQSHLLRLSLSL